MSNSAKTCPVSRSAFAAAAKPLVVPVAGNSVSAEPREFSTHSLGYFVNAQGTVDVGGVSVPCTISVQVTLNHSKGLPALSDKATA